MTEEELAELAEFYETAEGFNEILSVARHVPKLITRIRELEDELCAAQLRLETLASGADAREAAAYARGLLKSVERIPEQQQRFTEDGD